MFEEAGHEVEGEGELAPPDGRAKTGFSWNKPTQREREEHEVQHTCCSEIGAHTV